MSESQIKVNPGYRVFTSRESDCTLTVPTSADRRNIVGALPEPAWRAPLFAPRFIENRVCSV
jgi:hypothetical protein